MKHGCYVMLSGFVTSCKTLQKITEPNIYLFGRTCNNESPKKTRKMYGRAIQLQIQLGQIFKPRRLAGPVISAAKQLVMTHFKTNTNKFIEYM